MYHTKQQIESSARDDSRRLLQDREIIWPRQMDWGFVNVECVDGTVFQTACFAMICHHCGQRYIEFFPNAKQENLFIGMIHAFLYMGIPERVLTDNMKSVVIRRDSDGHPIWQHDYEVFMRTVGFETRLCRPRHDRCGAALLLCGGMR